MQQQTITPSARIAGMKAHLMGGAKVREVLAEQLPAPVVAASIPENHIMSSKDIAAITGKSHTHVIRDIRVMMADLEKGEPNLVREYNQGVTELFAANKSTQEFLMSRPMVELLITGYSTIHRAKALARLRELESLVTAPQDSDARAMALLENPEYLQRKLLEKTTRLIESEAENKILREDNALKDARIREAKPKEEFADAVRNMDGANGIGEVAKALGKGRNTLTRQMRKDGILMKGNEPYQKYIDRGYFIYKAVGVIKRSNGEEQAAMALFVTGPGFVFLQRKYAPQMEGQLRLV